MEASFLILAGGPLRTSSATRFARSRLARALAGRVAVVGAIGRALISLDPLDGRAGPLAVSPLGGVIRLGAESPVRISDVVGAPVLLDLGGRCAPRPAH